MKSEDLRDYEIRSQVYGNTGGGCMVATTEVYLPAKKKSVSVDDSRLNTEMEIGQ